MVANNLMRFCTFKILHPVLGNVWTMDTLFEIRLGVTLKIMTLLGGRACYPKVSKSIHAWKAVAKSQTLCLQSCFIYTFLPPFSLIRDFGKQNTRGNLLKISVSLT